MSMGEIDEQKEPDIEYKTQHMVSRLEALRVWVNPKPYWAAAAMSEGSSGKAFRLLGYYTAWCIQCQM